MIKFHPLVFFVGLLSGVDSRAFSRYCDLTPQPVIQLYRDPATGDYHVVRNGVDEPPGRDRSLWSNEMGPSLRGASFFGNNGVQINVIEASTSRQLNETGYNYEDELIAARKCFCAWNESVYCPADKQYCGIPQRSSPNQIRGCFNVNQQTTFVRSIWLYLVIWTALLIALIFFSRWGRMLLVTLPGNCICGYLEFRADRMMERNPDLANYLIDRNLRRSRRMLMQRNRQLTGEIPPFATPVRVMEERNEAGLANDSAKPPTSLALRTRVYRRNESPSSPSTNECDDNEFNDEDTCTICFAPLEDGERVGALACHHDFHVDCLKQWLSRRNCCPLCQQTDVATPQYEETGQ